MSDAFDARLVAALRECNLHGFNDISKNSMDWACEQEVILVNTNPKRTTQFSAMVFRLHEGELRYAMTAGDAQLVRFIKAKLAVLYLMVGIEGLP